MNRLVLILSALAITSVAQAQGASSPISEPSKLVPVAGVDATAHRHLGFALRLDGGIGYSSSTGMATSLGGATGAFGVVIGGAVMENLILGADFWGTGMFGSSPMMQSNGTGYGLWGAGVNVTYYLMPANVYFSASPSVTLVSSMSHSGSNYAMNPSNAGFGLKASVGKEWWVGDHWGIGLAAQFFGSWNSAQNSLSATWSTLGGGLAFSATYN